MALSPALHDLQAQLRKQRAKHAIVGNYTMRAPIAYAQLVVHEMNELGVEMDMPFAGDEVAIQFQGGDRVTIEVTSE